MFAISYRAMISSCTSTSPSPFSYVTISFSKCKVCLSLMKISLKFGCIKLFFLVLILVSTVKLNCISELGIPKTFGLFNVNSTRNPQNYLCGFSYSRNLSLKPQYTRQFVLCAIKT